MNRFLFATSVVTGVDPASADTPSYGGDRLEVGEARALLEANLALIERVAAFVCRRSHFTPDDAEEFHSVVLLKLVEHDYSVLRQWEGRSAISTYLNTVIQRWAVDYRIHEWGKWHLSAEAKRLGAMAMDLEQLLHRDGRAIEEALPFLAAKYRGVTLDSLKQLAARLPRRPARRHDVPVEEAESVELDGPRSIEDRALTDERRRTMKRVEQVIRDTIAKLSGDCRLLLQLRFEQGMTIAQIARALQRDQKRLYRDLEGCIRQIRAEAARSGLASGDVLDLIGRDDAVFSFDLGKTGPRPSKESDERVAARTEEPV